MLNGRLVGGFYMCNIPRYQCIEKLGDCTTALTLAITYITVGRINNPMMYTLLLLSNFNCVFHFYFSHLYLTKILNISIRYWLLADLVGRKRKSYPRNRDSGRGLLHSSVYLYRYGINSASTNFLASSTWAPRIKARSSNFSECFFPLSCISSLGFSIPDLPLIYFIMKVITSSIRNRKSSLEPIREEGNTPVFAKSLTLLIGRCSISATSSNFNRNLSAALGILFISCSIIGNPFIYFIRKVIKSFSRNRLSPLGPMRKLGNIPRLLQFLIVLMWTCNKLAVSLAVSNKSVFSVSLSETSLSGYSVVIPSILDYPFFVDKILPIDTIHDSNYRTVNLTSQKLTEYNSYVTNAYNRANEDGYL